MVVGGIETLTLRMAKMLKKRGHEVECYFHTIDTLSEIEFSSLKVYYRLYDSLPCDYHSNDIIIVFEMDTYLHLVQKQKKTNKKYNIFLYVVHPLTFDYFAKNYLQHRTKGVLFKSYCKFLDSAIKNKHIIFMDEECRKYISDKYGINSSNMSHLIVPLVLGKNTISCNNPKIRNSILTVSRADFPFKGYIKGLINQFEKYLKSGKEGKLTIISSGQHLNEIKRWISNTDSSIQEKIQLITNVPYTELFSYYESNEVYIGMGTTVLEAASCGTISIPVASYTFDCVSTGFLMDNPFAVTADKNNSKDTFYFVNQVLSFSAEELNKFQIRSKQIIEECYSEEVVYEKFGFLFENSKSNDLTEDFPWLFIYLKRVKEKIKLIKSKICN